jgi:alpha-N-arabinofuranosidase
VPFKVGIFLNTKGNILISLKYLENNRSLDGWSAYGSGSISLANDQPLSAALPAHMKFSLTSSSTSPSGFTNGGFFGIKVEAQTYNASFFYKPLNGASVGGGKLTIGLRNSDGSVTFGSTTVDVSSASIGKWSNYLSLINVNSAAPSVSNQLFIEFPAGSNGDFEFNLISCFPPTFKDRINGARKDIAQVFADLKLGFVRLPGGNDVEGRSIPDRFIWNETIGPLENRPGRRGSWVGYNTEGFGLIELLTFVEDIGALPLLAVYAGYSLDGRSVPENQLQPYIDEVVDEINFLIAPATENSMGALRARLGRSKPFDIRYVEIGNEDGGRRAGPTYGYRWADFYKALSQRFPNITFIATTASGISSPPAVDDHYYKSPEFFIENFRRYENVSRPTPKVLVGEFAVLSSSGGVQNNDSKIAVRLPYPSVTGAVAESVFRIGFERNSDIVIGGAYAPVLQNVHSTQWTPNLILFDASMVVKSTSHLAQQIFGQNLGNLLLNSTASNGTIAHENVQKGGEGDGKLGNLYFVATKDTNMNSLIVKFANADANDITVNTQIQGSSTSSAGVAYILSAGPGVDPATAYNTLENPNAVTIKNASVSVSSGIWSVTVPSWGVVVVTIPL